MSNPCDIRLFAALLPCWEDGKCRFGHSTCPPERVRAARAYYRSKGIGYDGKGLDRLRGTALEPAVAALLEAFPGTRLVSLDEVK